MVYRCGPIRGRGGATVSEAPAGLCANGVFPRAGERPLGGDGVIRRAGESRLGGDGVPRRACQRPVGREGAGGSVRGTSSLGLRARGSGRVTLNRRESACRIAYRLPRAMKVGPEEPQNTTSPGEAGARDRWVAGKG